jgi:hypothetical protein
VIGDSTAIWWATRWRETSNFEAKSNKGQSRSPLKKREEWLKRSSAVCWTNVNRKQGSVRSGGSSTATPDGYANYFRNAGYALL